MLPKKFGDFTTNILETANKLSTIKMKKITLCCLFLTTLFSNAQTDIDGLMMNKKTLCIGGIYQYSSWNQYWEGTFKRLNLNLGTVATKTAGIMGNYGLTNKLNFIFSLPYIQTNASAGTMKGQKGFQDISLTLKYSVFQKTIHNNIYSLYTLGSFSTPVTDYVADYLPLSIGLQSKTGTLRLMADYQRDHFFTTLSGAYIKRANIKIDRDSYLTDEIQYTNEVNMPDLISINFRLGYRSNRLIAEVVLDNMVSQSGGFDITKNNMPFPSNTMNALKYEFNAKYTFKKLPQLSLVGGSSFVLEGRNVGQSNTIHAGMFYAINLKK
jgi:hypothetical protein